MKSTKGERIKARAEEGGGNEAFSRTLMARIMSTYYEIQFLVEERTVVHVIT